MDIEELANDLAATDGDPRKLALFFERYIADERLRKRKERIFLGLKVTLFTMGCGIVGVGIGFIIGHFLRV